MSIRDHVVHHNAPEDQRKMLEGQQKGSQFVVHFGSHTGFSNRENMLIINMYLL